MVTKIDALDRLHKEQKYEDELVENINTYIILCIDHINELSMKEKATVRNRLVSIMDDSRNHSMMFQELIDWVVKNEKDSY